ncbi:hypothetical protein RZN05_03600 [Sphingomonas sp. HF-S4]|uniref:Nitroreductase domain-containing protein n=1 Tax=Sphingomonas agrestis TaxID=3080540 RepID=A0ABU3Y3U8_9SPHN|nr:hypothetical protein [Sphingomonas sp. HF-S4]MDV3456054.1 hypothetical protein [Sphingomonas sp. HF-S4]
MRDHLLGTTHRKDALRGELWDRLRGQLYARPAETSPAPRPAFRTVATAGPDLEATPSLSSLLRHALGILRWEPLNPNAEHRAHASPGSRFTVDAMLSVRGAGETVTYRYMPRDHALVRVLDRQRPVSEGSVAITLSCDLARCATPYGELAYCLGVLELGSVLAQLALVAGSLGLPLDRVILDGEGPRVTAMLGAPEIAIWLRDAADHPRTVLTQDYPPLALGEMPLLAATLRTHFPAMTVEHLTACWPANAPCTLFDATRRRSSGLRLDGGASATPDSTRLARWRDLATATVESFAGLERHSVCVDILMPPDAQARAWGYAAPPGAAVVTLSADLDHYLRRFGDGAVFHMHLAVGIASQAIALASAAMGFACRPMRSFDHAAADAMLPIEHWSVLQLVVWQDAAVNPGFATA